MESDYIELKKIVEDAKFEDYEEFSYAGVNYLLFPCEYSEEERERGSPPVFFTESSVVNWDIYFATGEIDERFRKPVLLHEIIEAERLSSFIVKGKPLKESRTEAHDIAMAYDNKYAKEILETKDYEDYCIFTEEFRRKF